MLLDDETFSFSGVNIYWLGQDENNPDSPNGPKPYFHHPSHFRIDDVLYSAYSMGSRVVRSHTLGVSTGVGDYHYNFMGWNGTLWPASHAPEISENFASIDYALYKAGQLGLKLIIPLTDNWNYYHGGLHDFLGWRSESQLEGVKENCVCNIDQHLQDIFFTNDAIISDFKSYISFVLNHVNPRTGLALKEDPTIVAWETGNELYYPTINWTINIASYIKEEIGAKQLVMDGKMISRTGMYEELEDQDWKTKYQNAVDIVSDHYYPLSVGDLLESAAHVAELGLPFVVGEIGWTKSETLTFLEAVEELHEDGLVSGSLFWSMFGHAETFGHVTHNDGYSMYWPNGPEPESFHHNNPLFKMLMKNISDHMFRMSGEEIPESYPMSSSPPLITTLECNPGQWINIAFRGVAGSYVYTVYIDEQPVALIEDRQTGAIYVHNDVVHEGSEVLMVALTYPDMKEGPVSEPVQCP